MSAHDGLVVVDATVRYQGLVAVDSVSLEVPGASVVALLGANGAGKSSLLNAIGGVVPLSGGTVTFGGNDTSRVKPHRAPRLGMALVPESRELFPELSVEMNLLLGAYANPGGRSQKYAEVLDLFPVLADKRKATAQSLSGGQQQMVAIARGLMSSPRLLLLDEPSLGLAPIAFREILDKIAQISAGGTAVLLVEQNARAALDVSTYAYVLKNGTVSAEGTPQHIHDEGLLVAGYLGG
jgi:branched-chain amino acid transport system ATP-binding protein